MPKVLDKNLPSAGVWTVPAPTFKVVSAHGTAKVGAWNTAEAARKGRKFLTDYLGFNPGDLNVYVEG